jgi:hypothetical protein
MKNRHAPRRSGPVALGTAAAVLALFAAPNSAHAQPAWDGPMLLAPGAPAGWGFHLVDIDPGEGLGGLVTWRANPAPVGLGFRVGLVEGARDDVALIGGVDVSGALYSGSGDVPLDIMWLAGAGLGIDDDIRLSFPLGVSFGWAFNGPDVQFRPYVAPRIVLDAFLGDDDPGSRNDDDLDLGFAGEIGLDLAFSQPWAIRTAASFGDREAVSIGISLPAGS